MNVMSNAEHTVSVGLGGSLASDLIAAERAILDEERVAYETFLADPAGREARRLADLAMLDEAFGGEDES